MRAGDRAQRSLHVTADLVAAFAEVTGDRNPVHMSEEYAAHTRFGRRIAHGMIGGALISAALANDLPGPGTVYLAQQLKFHAPVFLDDEITAIIEVESWEPSKRVASLATTCVNQAGEVVISGKATVLVDGAP